MAEDLRTSSRDVWSWRFTVLLGAGFPLGSGLVLSGIANRLVYLTWGVGVAILASMALRLTWTTRGKGIVSALAALSAAFLCLGPIVDQDPEALVSGLETLDCVAVGDLLRQALVESPSLRILGLVAGLAACGLYLHRRRVR